MLNYDYLLKDVKRFVKTTPMYSMYLKHIDKKVPKGFPQNRLQKEYDVMIETTNYCNSKCSFCPNSTLQRERKIMDDETFNLIIKRILDERIKVNTFLLQLNGEPLTDPKICDRIRELKRAFPCSKIQFTSNFSLANDGLIRGLIHSGLDSIVISLNSIDEIEYKEIMSGLDYSKTLDNVNLLFEIMDELNKTITVTFSIVVREENAEAVKEFKRRWGSKGKIREMTLGQWVDKETPKGIKTHRRIRRKTCSNLYDIIAILSNGDYALCCFDAEGIINKNVRDTPIMEMYMSDIFNDIREHHIKYGKTNDICKNCSF